jgi:hypothetical protein
MIAFAPTIARVDDDARAHHELATEAGVARDGGRRMLRDREVLAPLHSLIEEPAANRVVPNRHDDRVVLDFRTIGDRAKHDRVEAAAKLTAVVEVPREGDRLTGESLRAQDIRHDLCVTARTQDQHLHGRDDPMNSAAEAWPG